jgi:hypothetical protein
MAINVEVLGGSVTISHFTEQIAPSLAILVYIAVVITGIFTANQNISASSLNYVHKSNLNIAPVTIPLHGVNLSANQFILLYGSTPYTSKGHIALNLPCDASTPNVSHISGSSNYKSNHNLVNITPFPCLTWLKRPYNRMFSRFEMFCCMLVTRRVTATYMTT